MNVLVDFAVNMQLSRGTQALGGNTTTLLGSHCTKSVEMGTVSAEASNYVPLARKPGLWSSKTFRAGAQHLVTGGLETCEGFIGFLLGHNCVCALRSSFIISICCPRIFFREVTQ